MKDGLVVRPAGLIATLAEVNEVRTDAYNGSEGFHGDEPKVTWDGVDFIPGEPSTLEPIAAFVAVVDGLIVTVDGSASFDLDPYNEVTPEPLTYEWTFGDTETATGATPAAHTYAVDGTYDITLLVTDASGAFGEITQAVTVAAGV